MATRPAWTASWPRSTAARGPTYLTQHRPARGAARPPRRGAPGRPRPAGRRAGQPRARRVLRRPLLPARRQRRGAGGPPPRRARQRDRPAGPAQPGRGARPRVPHRGGDRALLACLRPDARPRRQAACRSRGSPSSTSSATSSTACSIASSGSGRRQGSEREATLCLAQAHAAAGDFGTARQQLETLLAANPRDTALLKQLSELAESEGDLVAATKYQKQLNEVAPSHDAAHRLVQLALRAGRIRGGRGRLVAASRATRTWRASSRRSTDLLSHGKYEAVLATTRAAAPQGPRQLGAPLPRGPSPSWPSSGRPRRRSGSRRSSTFAATTTR